MQEDMHKGGQQLESNTRLSSRVEEQLADPSVESIITSAQALLGDRNVKGTTKALPTTMQGIEVQETQHLGQSQGNHVQEAQVEHQQQHYE